jgi:hypothetical protein
VKFTEEALSMSTLKSTSIRFVPRNEISEVFSVRDPKAYRWSIYNATLSSTFQKTVHFLSALISGFAVGWFLGFVPFWIISLVSKQVAFYAALVALAIETLLFFRQHWLALKAPEPYRYIFQINLPLFSVYPTSTILFVLSSRVPIMEASFAGNTSSMWEWFLFMAENVANVLAFGLPEAIGVNLSLIQPTTWYTRSGEQFLQIFFAIGLIEFIILMHRLSFSKHEFIGTIRDAIARCFPLPQYTGQLMREACLDPLSHPEVVNVQAFRSEFPLQNKAFYDRSEEEYFAEYSLKALQGGGGTSEGAVAWLYLHRPPNRASAERINAWLNAIKAFEQQRQNIESYEESEQDNDES